MEFREDHNRIRRNNAPKDFGSLVRIVLNLLKMDDTVKGSMATKRRHALLDVAYRERLLSLA